ncbi:MAG: hypothetical protein IAF38_20290 [Bacteroidia bacterium]|nr:hypothetical protein [Bacteroidia bacterium]
MNSVLKNICFIFLFVLISLSKASAQKYPFVYYNIKEGLAHSQICALFEDSKGKVWMPTMGGGISVFNGKEFITINKKNGLKHLSVRCVAEDATGIIYAGAFGGGLYKIINDSAVSISDSTINADIFAMCIWKHQLWLGAGNGLYCFDGKSFQNISRLKNIPDFAITFMNVDKENKLWFGYDSQYGLYNYDGNAFKIYNDENGLHKGRLLNVCHDKNNEHWVAAYDGVFRIKNNSSFAVKDSTSGLPTNYPFDFVFQYDGKVLIGSTNFGVSIYDPAAKTVEHIQHLHGMKSDLAFRLLKDREGNVWVSNWGDGVARFLQSGLCKYDADFGLKEKVIHSVFSCEKKILVNTSDAISVLENNSFKEFFKAEGKGIANCFFSSEKDFWIMYTSSLHHIVNGKKTVYTGDSVTALRTAVKDKNGIIYFGGWGSGLIKFDPEKGKLEKFKDSLAQVSIYIYSVFIDSKNNLWAGTWGGGLLKYSGNACRQLNEKSGLHSDRITALCEDKNGNIFAGSIDAGIAMIKPDGKIFFFDRKDGLEINSVNALCVQNDKLWIGEIGHVERIKIQNDKITEIEKWEEEEGFNGDVMFNGIFVADDKTVWIGTNDFLYHYDETRRKLTGEEDLVFISQLKAKDRSFSAKDSLLSFDHTENRITFSFFSTRKFRHNDVSYKYRMLGLDTTFTFVKNNNDVVFHELPPGEYTFEIYAIYNNKISEPARLSFSITPPFWKRTWFYLLSGLSILFVIFQIVKQRETKLQKAKILLEKTVQERTREIQLQKEIVEVKNKEIMDSMRYARRIQNALMSSEKNIKRNLDRLQNKNKK